MLSEKNPDALRKEHLLYLVALFLLGSLSNTNTESLQIFYLGLGTFIFVAQSLSCVRLFVTPWTAACQAPLPSTISWNLLKFMSTELVMLSNHLIFCAPFSFCLQSLPPLGSFPVSQLLALGGQSIRASASVLPMNIQD